MATNIVRDGDDTMVIESVGANYAAGAYIAQGLMGGISLNAVSTGADAGVQYKGEVSYAKTAGQTWTEGQELFFDSGTDKFTTIATADGIVRGYAAADAVLAATSGLVTLCEGHYTATGAFVAYDNSTSSLAATTVQGAIDEVEGRVDGLESGKMDLVAAPVAGDLIEMDASGQGVPSGLTTADVQVLTVPAAAGNLAELSGTGALADSGVDPATLQVLVVPTAAGNIATLSALGAVEDSTIASASIAGAITMGTIYNNNMRNSTNTAQSLADATEEVIDLEDVELAGDVTYAAGTTSLATIPAGGTGLYAIVYGATFAAGAGTYNQIAIKISGTTRASEDTAPDNANPIVVEGNVMLPLTAGDTVGLYAKQDSGGALDVTSAYMAIQRIQ